MRNALVALVLFGLLGFAAFEAYRTWVELGPVDMGFDGRLALGLMIALTLAVGAGLMTLVFYSSRHGRDQ